MHQLILPLDKSRQARDLEMRQEKEMTKFLQEFDGIDEVIREEVHWTEETAYPLLLTVVALLQSQNS